MIYFFINIIYMGICYTKKERQLVVPTFKIPVFEPERTIDITITSPKTDSSPSTQTILEFLKKDWVESHHC